MLLAADPLANFIDKNPTVVMLALGFLLMIGMVLIADGFGVHVPKGYIYAAMAFSALRRGAEHAQPQVRDQEETGRTRPRAGQCRRGPRPGRRDRTPPPIRPTEMRC